MTAPAPQSQQIKESAPRDMEAVRRYVEMRRKMPLSGLGDSVHHIHASTEFEAELRLSDLEAIIASGDVRAAVIEECAKEAVRLYEKPGWSPHYKNAAITIAGMIRALSQAPAMDATGTMVVGRVTGKLHEGDQCRGMPDAICHACGLGYKCLNLDCPNDKPNPAFGGRHD